MYDADAAEASVEAENRFIPPDFPARESPVGYLKRRAAHDPMFARGRLQRIVRLQEEERQTNMEARKRGNCEWFGMNC